MDHLYSSLDLIVHDGPQREGAEHGSMQRVVGGVRLQSMQAGCLSAFVLEALLGLPQMEYPTKVLYLEVSKQSQPNLRQP